MMKKSIVLSMVSVLVMLSLVACKGTDVLGKGAVTSFDKVVDLQKDSIVSNTGEQILTLPDGTSKFIIGEKIQIEVDIEPFLAAGLDVSKLPAGVATENTLIFGIMNKGFTKKDTITAAFDNFVTKNRKSIGFHTALGHYNVNLQNGNAFEFAKDLEKNDKDMVLVLEPKTLIDAGVDVNKIEGFVFAKVKVMDENGKEKEVDKVLKPFDLK